jgi:hypothetical protein
VPGVLCRTNTISILRRGQEFRCSKYGFFLIGTALVRDQVLLLVKPLRTNRSKGVNCGGA